MKSLPKIIGILILALSPSLFSFKSNKLESNLNYNGTYHKSELKTKNWIEIIHCTGSLRRPKALDCDNDGVAESCDCGFGVCNFHCSVLGWQVFRDSEGLPIDNSKLNEDQYVLFKSNDGKYLLYKFIYFKDAGRSEDPFIIDDSITYSFSSGNVRVLAQTGSTFYPSQLNQGRSYIESISKGDSSYFGVDIDEIRLDNALAFAIVSI